MEGRAEATVCGIGIWAPMILSVWGVVEGATDGVGGIRERTTVSPENAYVISASLGTSARNTRRLAHVHTQATSKIRATHTELYYNLYTVSIHSELHEPRTNHI